MNRGINDELIIAYINDALSEKDRISFEKEMETNPLLTERYTFLKNVAVATQLKMEAQFKESLIEVEAKLKSENFFQEIPTEETKSERKPARLRYAIGSFCLLIIVSLILINLCCSDTAIVTAAMENERMRSFTTRSENQNESYASYQNALNQFHQGNATKSLELLKKINTSAVSYSEAQYAMAYIHYKEGNCKEAGDVSSTLLFDDCEIKDKAGWLHLNVSIQCLGYNPSLIDTFLQSNPKKYYREKAKNLKAKMDGSLRFFVF